MSFSSSHDNQFQILIRYTHQTYFQKEERNALSTVSA
jgi:hypothetical protein